MGKPIQPRHFLTCCKKHGFDIHDGSKNECCDLALIMPMLEINDIERLSDKAFRTFCKDLDECNKLLESSAFTPPEELVEWASAASKRVYEIDKDDGGERIGGEDEEDVDLAEEEQIEYIYMQGFMNGFSVGFDKGFDAGFQLKPKNK